ncbi:hypothetical protein [Arenicella xantha]|uniref:SnoaL-like protein n=1 Tax=Arenicella xantha TaxID=644221 RepID=A0A395JM46_9GAMM|nr:hypothetical protein [Arenicella xantha]RBP51495.1 hypothetical protein DFR28_102925 [Arenicella xantha]
MKLILLLPAVLICAACSTVSSPRNSAIDNQIQELASRYFEALNSQDFEAAALMVDPSDLQAFRDKLLITKDVSTPIREEFIYSYFGPDASDKSVEALTDAQYYGKMSKSIYATSQGTRTYTNKFKGPRIIGSVKEHNNAHVVIEYSTRTVDGTMSTLVEVVTLRNKDNTWFVAQHHEMTALADRIASMFNQ